VKTIWKFPLSMTTFQKIDMPRGAQLLSVQPQSGNVCLWALVDPTADKTPTGVWIHGTGHELDTDKHLGRHISTFQLDGGSLVFHAFEHNYDA
jgi:hypothetical protein